MERIKHLAGVIGLIRDFLTKRRARQARLRMRQLSEESQARLGSKTWTRADLYDR